MLLTILILHNVLIYSYLPENENITMCSYPDILKCYNIKTVPYMAECYSEFASSITEDLYVHFQSISNSTFNSSLNNFTRNSGNVLVLNIVNNVLVLNINIAEGITLHKLLSLFLSSF